MAPPPSEADNTNGPVPAPIRLFTVNSASTGPPANDQPDELMSTVSVTAEASGPAATVNVVADRSGGLSCGGPPALIETLVKPPPEQLTLSAPLPPSLALHPAVSAPPVEDALETSVA